MKTSALFKLAGIIAIVYCINKIIKSSVKRDKPGAISTLFNELKEEAEKPLNEVAEEIPDGAV